MEKAISWWEKAASQNNPASLCILAQIYEEGIHKPRNEEMFLQLYRKAAEGGDAIAQNALGHFYTLGLHGFPKDPKLAFQWTLKSAEQGNSSAMVNLGYFYEVGDGSTDPKRVFDRSYGIVPRDYDKAAEWYEKQRFKVMFVRIFTLLQFTGSNQTIKNTWNILPGLRTWEIRKLNLK